MSAATAHEVRDTAGSYALDEVAAVGEAVPVGYQRTEVGVIPEDWAVVKAGDIGRFRGGNGFPLRYQGGSTGAFPFFKVSDMNNEGNETFMRFANHYVSATVQKELGATIFPPGSITFAKVGAAIFLERKKILGQPSCIDNNVAAFVLDQSASDVRFIHYQLLDTKLSDLASTTALPSLSGKVLRELLLVLPAPDEQRAIAAALSDADALLLGLDQLIAKKRDLKQAAMQHLLTGKTRLPGFDEEWTASTVGHEFDIKLGKMLDSEKNSGAMKPYIGNRAVQWGRIDVSELSLVAMSSDDVEKYRLQDGDLLVCEGGEVGRAAIWESPVDECYYQKALHRLRPRRGFNSRLMIAFLQFWTDQGLLANYVTQTSIAHLTREKFAEVPMQVPSPAEQTAIATILSDMDAELGTLETRRDKTRELKQGMMQALLSGRIRLT